MLKFSEIFEFSSENSYFERIRTVRMVRMVRMVRSLADRTFQLWLVLFFVGAEVPVELLGRLATAAVGNFGKDPRTGFSNVVLLSAPFEPVAALPRSEVLRIRQQHLDAPLTDRFLCRRELEL